MATADKEFLLRVKADIESAVKDMTRLTGTLKEQANVAKKGMEDPTPKMREGMKKTTSIAGDLKRELTGLFSLAAIGAGVKEGAQAIREYTNTFRGLEAVANHAGVGIRSAWQVATDLSKDGLLNVADAAKALQNLLSRGYKLDEALQTIRRLKDAAAFNRASHLELGEAVVTATEGLKNENSVLVDNAGVTKNVSVLWKEYAERVGKSVNDLTQQEKIQAEVNGIMRETEAQVGNAAKAAEGAEGEYGKFAKATRELAVQFGDSLGPAISVVLEYGTKFITWLKQGIGYIKGFGAFVGATVKSIDDAIEGNFDAIGENFDRAKKMMNQYVEEATNGTVSVTKSIKDNVDEQAQAADDRRRAAAEELKLLGKRLALVKANVDAESRLAQDAVQRRLRALDAELAADLVGRKEYYQRRQSLEEEATDAEIRKTQQALEAQRKALKQVKKDEDRLPILTAIKKLETDLIILQGQRADAGVKAANDQAQAERDLAQELTDLRARLLTAQGRGAEGQILQLESEFKQTLKRMKDDPEGAALVQKLFDTEVAKAQFDKMADDYNAALARMAREEQSIQLEMDSGLISQHDAQERIVKLHQATAAELEKQIPLMAELASQLGPEAEEQVRRFGLEIKRLEQPISAAAARMRGEFRDSMKDTFADIFNGAKSAREAIEDFGKAILNMVNQRIAEQLADSFTSALFKPAGKNGQGGGFLFDLFSSFGLFHTGGIVGAGAPMSRSVSPFVFANAPRYHTGGFPGLTPDEVPIIAQKGEEILSRHDPRNSLNGGGQVINRITIPITPVDQSAANAINRSKGQLAFQIGREVDRQTRRKG